MTPAPVLVERLKKRVHAMEAGGTDDSDACNLLREAIEALTADWNHNHYECALEEIKKLRAALAEAERQRQRDEAIISAGVKNAALHEIAHRHLGDCPAAQDERTFALNHINSIRKIAYDALSPSVGAKVMAVVAAAEKETDMEILHYHCFSSEHPDEQKALTNLQKARLERIEAVRVLRELDEVRRG